VGYFAPYVGPEGLVCEVELEDRCLEETFTRALAFPSEEFITYLSSRFPGFS